MPKRALILLALVLPACGFREIEAEAPACAVYVVASDSHTCARKTDGALMCWGNNQHGQLGTGDTEARTMPARIESIELGPIAGIYVPTGAGDISTRTSFTCARKTDGTLWCWGSNEYGQLGTGDRDDRLVPTPVLGLGTDVHAASLGSAFACARKTDNSIWCWGANESGQLGTGDTENRTTPVQVDPAGLGTSVRYLATGVSHACARKTDGTLWCWGSNQYGQLGTGDTERRLTPARVDADGPLATDVDVVTVGAGHTCATRTDSSLWCWGADHYGQLGIGGGIPRFLPETVAILNLAGGVPLVSAGGFHTCAAKVDGTVLCWGDNRAGQLGIGAGGSSPIPVEVDASQLGKQIAVLYAGGAHTCARTSDNALFCWGSNQYGQLGIGPVAARMNAPAEVEPPCP